MSAPPSAPLPEDEPADWPEWVQSVVDPQGERWRVKTVDLLEASGQFARVEARTLAQNVGRYQTTIERPEGALRSIYLFEKDEAEAYHRRTVRRVRLGEL